MPLSLRCWGLMSSYKLQPSIINTMYSLAWFTDMLYYVYYFIFQKQFMYRAIQLCLKFLQYIFVNFSKTNHKFVKDIRKYNFISFPLIFIFGLFLFFMIQNLKISIFSVHFYVNFLNLNGCFLYTCKKTSIYLLLPQIYLSHTPLYILTFEVTHSKFFVFTLHFCRNQLF